MNSDIRGVVAALLSDRNAPPALVEKLVETCLDHCVAPNRSILDTLRHALLSMDSTGYQLAGPIPSLDSDRVRVARVMDIEQFAAYFLRLSPAVTGRRADMASRVRMLDHVRWLIDHGVLNDPRFQAELHATGSTHMSPAWVTLAEEVEEQSLPDLAHRMGLFHLRERSELVSVTYEVASTDVRVPTVLDAHLDPSFVPKPRDGSASVSRAWDWELSEWGMSELVHGGGVACEDVEVRLLGSLESSPCPPPQLRTISLPLAPEVAEAVETALQRAASHVRLEPFLLGRVSVLDLTPRQFEVFLGDMYERQGYRVTVTPASHDDGIDLIAISDREDQRGILLQAKHVSRKVGVSAVRELFGARYLTGHTPEDVMLVIATTGSFSGYATRLATLFASEIQLLNYEAIIAELNRYAGIGVSDVARDAIRWSRGTRAV